jgi:tripartite ATP-independent transporter DctM subunit
LFMDWQIMLLAIFGSLVILMATGLPVAFSFLLVMIVFAPIVWGGAAGLPQVISGMSDSIVKFVLLPLPMFILMGEVMFHSGIAPQVIGALDNWLGKLPGRLGLLSVGAGTVFASLTGTSIASIAMLGTTLVPEMEKRGYKKSMSLGPIMGSGGLAALIPPSGLAVLLGAIGEISIGSLLLAIIGPGLVLAALFALYIILRSKLQPSVAPPYDVSKIPLSQKLVDTGKYILPLGLVVFAVIGVMILGIATPTEASATGAISCFILAVLYKRLNWSVIKKTFTSTLRNSTMILMILTASAVFSQILSFSGAAAGLSEFAINLPMPPLAILISMQIVLVFLGMFMDIASIMMITLPIFMPIVRELGFNDVWFGAIFLVNMEMAMITPPFGLSLFTMKGVAPADTTIGDVIRAALPFLVFDVIAIALVFIFPEIALWLPGVAM